MGMCCNTPFECLATTPQVRPELPGNFQLLSDRLLVSFCSEFDDRT